MRNVVCSSGAYLTNLFSSVNQYLLYRLIHDHQNHIFCKWFYVYQSIVIQLQITAIEVILMMRGSSFFCYFASPSSDRRLQCTFCLMGAASCSLLSHPSFWSNWPSFSYRWGSGRRNMLIIASRWDIQSRLPPGGVFCRHVVDSLAYILSLRVSIIATQFLLFILTGFKHGFGRSVLGRTPISSAMLRDGFLSTFTVFGV